MKEWAIEWWIIKFNIQMTFQSRRRRRRRRRKDLRELLTLFFFLLWEF